MPTTCTGYLWKQYRKQNKHPPPISCSIGLLGYLRKSLNINAGQHADAHIIEKKTCNYEATEEVPAGDEALPLMPRSLLKNLVLPDVAGVDVAFEIGAPAGPDVELVELAT